MKKTIKPVINIIISLLIFVLLEQIAAYAIIPSNSYVKKQFEEFYSEKNIDVVFLGPSFIYRGIDPRIVDSETGLNTFNFGTSGQQPIDSYYVLKEAARNNILKVAVIDISFGFYSTSEDSPKYNRQSTFLIYDQMKNSKIKKEYKKDVFAFDDTLSVYFKSTHYPIKSFDSVLSNFNMKIHNIEAPLDDGIEKYEAKGFVSSTMVYNGENNLVPHRDEINNESIEYLDKMIDFCKEKGITPIVAFSPKTDDYINQFENSEELFDSIEKHLSEKKVIYHNVFKDIETNICANEYFIDAGHMNTKGAEAYSHIVSDYINLLYAIE